MFEKGKTVDGNGEVGQKSASDQIIILRRFGLPIEIEIAGQKFTIKPGTYFLNSLLADIVDKYRGDNKDAINRIIESDKKATNAKVVETMMNDFRAAIKSMRPALFKCVQLILLDNKTPEWKRNTEGMPTDEELEKTISSSDLAKFATIEEINIVIDAYSQLNRPEMPRQNFLKLGEAM